MMHLRARRTLSTCLLIIATTACVFNPASVAAETHALVVGIDKYRNIRPLKGAVADALDISAALMRRGVAVKPLLDGQATRTAVLGELDRIVARASRGDLVIIAFAGHGAREQWGDQRPPGVAVGAPREVFLLADVNLPNAGGRIDQRLGGSASERIAGGEIAMRLSALERKGVRTIFVADTCHAGGLTRAPLIETAAESVSYRYVPIYRFNGGEDPLAATLGALPRPIDTDTELRDLTFLAAVEKEKASPEVLIPNGSKTWRGALSYAFARVIDGSANIGRDGSITRAELVDYVNATVRTHAANEQEPDLRPRDDFNRPVLNLTKDFGAPVAPCRIEAAPTIVRVHGAPGLAGPQTYAFGAFTIAPAPSEAEADLIVRSHGIYTRSGDLITSAANSAALAGAAEREIAIRRLQGLSLCRPREIRLRDGDQRYVAGERVIIDARPRDGSTTEEYYALFAIAGTGIVQFLYPMIARREAPILRNDRPFDEIQVLPPFGSDMIVLITSPKPFPGFVSDIAGLHDRVAALRAVDLIAKLPGEVRIGLQSLFTVAHKP